MKLYHVYAFGEEIAQVAACDLNDAIERFNESIVFEEYSREEILNLRADRNE